MTLLHQDTSGNVPDQTDLQAWVNAHGITHPVLSDPQQDVGRRWATGQPRLTLLAPGGEIVVEGVFSVTDAQIEAVLPP